LKEIETSMYIKVDVQQRRSHLSHRECLIWKERERDRIGPSLEWPPGISYLEGATKGF
jgi:hypothetical protein